MDSGMSPVTTTITSSSVSPASISGNTEIATAQAESSFIPDLDLVNFTWIKHIDDRTIKAVDFCNLPKACFYVDKVDESGWTPLIAAASYGWIDPVKELIAAGANIDKADIEGCTALLVAAMKGFTRVVKVLIEAGSDVDHEDKSTRTALHHAVKKGNTAIVVMLIDAGANFDKASSADYDCTPLFLASYGGKDEVVSVLVGAGANIDQPCSEGTTPLCIAVKYQEYDAAKILIAAGASLEKADDAGKTPKELLGKAFSGAKLNTYLRLAPDQPFIRCWPSYLTLKNMCRHKIRARIHTGAGISQLKIAKLLTIYIMAGDEQASEVHSSQLGLGTDVVGRRQRGAGQ